VNRDLRQFLESVRRERPSDVLDVEREVSPRYETAAILAKLEARHRSPLLFFQRVAGCGMPVVSNVCGSLGRLALALGCSPNELSRRYDEGCREPIAPVRVADGPVREVVCRGDEVDLGVLPALVYHEQDAPGPWITGAIVAARDPETRRTNLSYHRLMVAARDVASIWIAPGKHLDAIHRKYEAAGRPMPIAAFVGSHPAWSLGALFTGSPDVEEWSVIGGLLREPLELVCGVTQDVEAPAAAEIVLEGVVAPRERIEEGPLGEFTGFASGAGPAPAFRVTAIASRRQPIFQDVVSGHVEHLVLPLLGMERHLLEAARAAAPGVERVKLAAPLVAFVSMKKADDAEPRRVIDALLEADVYVKHVVVVDADVDPNDPRQVVAAIGLHVQPDRQVVVKPDLAGTPLDPSCDSPAGRTSKMGIDATARLSSPRERTRNAIPKRVLDAVDVDELLRPVPAAPHRPDRDVS
jgi:2,5-furandicarboxylate decarboxylase 1